MFEVMHRGKISGCPSLDRVLKMRLETVSCRIEQPVAAVHAEGGSSAASLAAGHSQTLLRS